MNKTEALDAVRFLRHSLFNTRAVNGLLESLEEYILTHDAEVIKQTLNGIYGIPDDTEIIMKPLEEVER